MEISTIYNPHEQTEQELLDGFVIREKEFKTIFNDIQKNKMQTPPQHYIVYGVRGNGKTSLLLKLFYEVRKDEDLNTWLIPVIFKEEQYNLRTLYKLWEHVAEYLGEDFGEFSDLMYKMEQNEESDNYEEKCFELLQSSIEKNGKKLVLFFDNFGVFLNKLTDREHQRLREVLITCSDIRIIGTSTFVDEVTYDYGKPFFDFFKPVYLKELNREDTIKLLLKLNEKSTSGDINKIIEQNPGRIEALRRLTNGIPRTIVLLYQIFIDNSNGNSFKDLDVLLDKVTPLYKSRMDDLPAQQQEIADIIAKNWDAITVKEIVKKSKIPSNAVSAQLKQLEKNRLIIKKGTSTKNNMYQIAERFFNIWYLMRNARNKDKCKVRWLVNFLEIWCDRKELTVKAKGHIEGLRTGKYYDKYAFHLSEAYAQMVRSSKMQHEIIVSTRKYLESIQSDLVNDLSDSDIELSKKAIEFFEDKKPELALDYFLKIERKKGEHYFYIGYIYHEYIKDLRKAVEFYLLAEKKNIVEAVFNLGNLYMYKLKDYKMAKEYFLKASEKGDDDASFYLGLLYNEVFKDYDKAIKYYLIAIEKDNVKSMFNLALLYEEEFQDFKKAEEYYLKAAEKGDSKSIYNLGYLYKNELREFKNAEKYYKIAIEIGEIQAMLNLALLYEFNLKDYQNAMKYYLMAIDNGDINALFSLGSFYKNELQNFKKAKEYYLKAIEKEHVGAMLAIGNLYRENYNDFKNAERYYLMAVEKENTGSMINMGNIYKLVHKDYRKAEEYYIKAIEKGDKTALLNLGNLYVDCYEDYKKAEDYYMMAIENGNTGAMINLGNLYKTEVKDYKKAEDYYLRAIENGYTDAIVNLGDLYESNLKDFKKAEEYYLMAVKLNDSDAMNSLAWMYFKLKKNKTEALNYAQQAFENEKDIFSSHTYSCILLWHNEIEKAIEISKRFMNNEKSYLDFSEDIKLFLLLLLAKKQYHYVLNLFKENNFNLPDRYKPIYYALMSLLQNEYPDEIKRMGSELEETVKEILEKIEQLTKDYE